MAVKIDGSKAPVCWLTDNSTGKLASGEGLLYVVGKTNPLQGNKLGEAKHGYTGLTPGEAFEKRYANEKANLREDHVAIRLYVVPMKTDFDDTVRERIHELKDVCQFDALTPRHQLAGYNSEDLIGYEDEQHNVILEKIIKELVGIDDYFNTNDPIVYRHEQENDVDVLCKIVSDGAPALYWGHTGRGKTIIGVAAAAKLCPTGGFVLVTTPIADTVKNFKKTINNNSFGDRKLKITFVDAAKLKTTSIEQLRERADAGELIIFCITVQDMRYDDGIDDEGLREKYDALSKIHIDLHIPDERHRHYDASKTRMRFANITPRYTIDLTATPYRLDKYAVNAVINRGLLWGILHRDKTKLPEIFIEGFNTPFSNLNPQFAELFNEIDGWDPRKMVLRKNGNFVYEKQLLDIPNACYINSISKSKNRLSIANDPELCSAAKQCGMWVLPAGDEGDSVTEYLPVLANLYNSHYSKKGIYFIDSYKFKDTCPYGNLVCEHTSDEHMAEWINQYGRVIILTHRMFVEGSDFLQLGHIVLLDKLNDVILWEQLLGRLMRVFPEKPSVKLYVAAPNVNLKSTYGQWARVSAKHSNGQYTEQQALDSIPLTEYNETGSHSVSADEIVKATTDHYIAQLTRGVSSQVIRDELDQLDPSELAHIMRGCKVGNYKMPRKFVGSLTDPNGAKIAITVNNTAPVPRTKTEHNVNENATALIRAVTGHARGVAVVEHNYDIKSLLKSRMMQDSFNKSDLEAVQLIMDMFPSRSLESRINEVLHQAHDAYDNINPADSDAMIKMVSALFTNNSHNKKKAMVYVPEQFAREVCNKLKKYGLKAPRRILVLNALNGVIPFILRIMYPTADIYCHEPFPSFKKFLDDSGFKTLTEKELKNMKKFDVVVGNPPYQAQQKATGKRGGGDAVWDKFVIKAFDLLIPHGILALITPSAWRKPQSDHANSLEVSKLLQTKQIHYLNINDTKEGMRVFGAGTRFDMYVAENCTPYTTTTIIDQNNVTTTIDLTTLPFIPNFDIDITRKVLVTPGEEPCPIIFSTSDYETRRDYVEEIKDAIFKYTLVHSTPKEGTRYMYSSRNDKGHFGISKVIFGESGIDDVIIDMKGQYGMTQHAMAIKVTSLTEAQNIKKALMNPKFKTFLAANSWSNFGIDWRLFTYLRKDFWKTFV